MCLGCSKEPSHRDGSFEYPQHMFWLRNKKNNFQLCTLIRGPIVTRVSMEKWKKILRYWYPYCLVLWCVLVEETGSKKSKEFQETIDNGNLQHI